MYIRVTERCNMSCAHCCMAATSKGEDMPWETFKAAVDNAEGDTVILGGGEPTLHPEFECFLFYALAHTEYVWLATNGSQTERALVLAKMAQRGIIGAALSIDQWHDPIDPRVIAAFTKVSRSKSYAVDSQSDNREIRDVGGMSSLSRVGRAARKSFVEEFDTRIVCACEGEPVVDPNGNVRQCGCPKSPIVGNVFDGFKPLGHDYDNQIDPWCCYRIVKKRLREIGISTAKLTAVG
jgi:MoaA/NifB/PqqE/SkfB family radical SAM enzyme